MKSRGVYIGIGFHRGVEAVDMERAIRGFLEEVGIELSEVKGLCTVDFRRLAKMEIVVVIYNPRSKTRKVQLEKAYELFMRFRDRRTIVGIVKNAEREGCEIEDMKGDTIMTERKGEGVLTSRVRKVASM